MHAWHAAFDHPYFAPDKYDVKLYSLMPTYSGPGHTGRHYVIFITHPANLKSFNVAHEDDTVMHEVKKKVSN